MKMPLQLERYFFTKMEVEANPTYVPQNVSEQQDIKLRLDLGLGEHKEDPTKFQVMVGIDELRVDKGELPYRIALRVIGQFVVDKDFKPKNLRNVVQVNGASMLYSAAREFVLMITGRGPWPAFQLPTLSLRDEIARATGTPTAEKENKSEKEPQLKGSG